MTVVFFFLRLSLELSTNHWDIKDSLRQRTSTHTLTYSHSHSHTQRHIRPVGHKVAGVTATVTEVKPRVSLEIKASLIERELTLASALIEFSLSANLLN